MSAGRIGNILIYESINSLDISKNDKYSVNYGGIIGANLTAKLITFDEILFLKKIYGDIPEVMFNERIYGNEFTSINMAPESAIQYTDIQQNKSINISRSFTSEQKKPYTGLFGNISLSFIRSEIGRILFLIILINIFQLVKFLIEDNKNEDKKIEDKLNLFVNLLLTAIVVGLILTLLPQSDVGDVILSLDLATGISAFLLIIAFILISLFKIKYLSEKKIIENENS